MNFEKPTKAFCTLAKAQKGNDSLNQLKKNDDQGNIVDYENDDEQNSDSGNYFKDIYSNILEKSLSLEQFLTPENMNSEYVQSKKLSNLDSERNNVPISHYKLTKALEETKIGSKPGLEGYTYAVLKFVCPLIGHPVAKGFKIMVDNSIGGIQLSFQGVYNSTGGIQISFLGVYNFTGGIQISFQGGNNSTGGIQISFQGGNNSTGGIHL